MAKKGGQVRELQEKLLNPDIQVKQEAIRRIIDAMTRGKDVSMLFMDVVKNMETPSLRLKKLIYLYVMSYSKVHSDLAILGTNSLRKDAIDKHNPFLRALAVRTMGCIRVEMITEYLLDPLKKALKDEDPYVRKTGALCVPKMLEIAPKIVQEQGFLKLLENLLNDGNATVVSNAVVALTICSEIKGEPLMKLTDILVQKLLTAMNDCNEWGVVYILDTLSNYIPKDPQEAESIMERVSSRLAHSNSAVALSSIKLMIRYMDYLSHPESIRTYSNKISAPLITMISRQSEVSYLVLKTINLVLQKRPLLLPKDLERFFVNYHDPLYVKLQKLEVLSKIANNENILLILHELKECVQEVDVEFVRKAVRTMGRCAIKLEKMADKCVQCLWETLKTKIPYVVQEAVIVIRDIFRKYPNKYEGLLSEICENLKSLDDPEAKASIVWIIGEYVEMIENADELLGNFADNFKDEPDIVQQQILISCMKLYMHNPKQNQELLKDLLNYITKECQNPDLRDRGFIYWRLLSANPQVAKKVVLSERPLISEQSYTLETELLERLVENIGTLSGVYYKQPEDFVKKLKENANAKEEIQEDPEELLPQNQKEEKVEFFDDKKEPISFANKQETLVENVASDVIIEQQPVQQPKKIENLLEMEEQPKQVVPKSDSLLDMDDTQQTVVNPPKSSEPHFQCVLKPQNIVIPSVDVLSEGTYSKNQKYVGLSIRAAFEREGGQVFLVLDLKNSSQVTFQGFALKMNSNAFKFHYPKTSIDEVPSLQPNMERSVKLELAVDGPESEIDGWPYFIDCAIKALDDIFIFQVPCSLSVAIVSGFTMNMDQYKEFAGNEANCKKQESLPNNLNVEEFLAKLKNNNLCQIFRRSNNENELMSFGCALTSGAVLVADVIFDTSSNSVNVQLNTPTEAIQRYFSHALAMIINI